MESKDHLTFAQRSLIMGKIKQKDTSPELLVRSLLHKMGYRFRKNVSTLPGKPDVVLPKYKAVVFIHGCYWHRHTCKRGQSIPTARKKFWEEKFANNVRRDVEQIKKLQAGGYRVRIVWECQLKRSLLQNTMDELDRWLQQE